MEYYITYKTFAKQSCQLSTKEYDEILVMCQNAIIITKKEIDDFQTKDKKIKDFLINLKDIWKENLTK